MTKGRKPIPTAIKKIRGTNQPCRTNKNEINIDPVIKLPPAPRWFGKTSKKIYKQKGQQLQLLGVLTPLDFELFISFCQEYGNYIDTSIELSKVPHNASLSDQSEMVFLRISKINKISWERSKSIAAEFGFTPSARAKMILPEKENNNDNDFD